MGVGNDFFFNISKCRSDNNKYGFIVLGMSKPGFVRTGGCQNWGLSVRCLLGNDRVRLFFCFLLSCFHSRVFNGLTSRDRPEGRPITVITPTSNDVPKAAHPRASCWLSKLLSCPIPFLPLPTAPTPRKIAKMISS